MASSQENKKFFHHACSDSLPEKEHPVISQINENLCRLKSSQDASSSSSSIRNNLSCLIDLHECIDSFLLLPLTQQAISRDCYDELLDGLLRLLDVCNIVKDAILQTKESMNELQLLMRRRQSCELAGEVRKYLASRKSVKKTIQKALKGIKSKSKEKQAEAQAITGILKEVEAATLTTFEFLLSFMACSKQQSKSCNRSLVSKMVYSKKVTPLDNTENASKLDGVDSALNALVHHKTGKDDSIILSENVQNMMGELQSSILDIEEELDCVFRCLIKTRVALLNIFNH